MAHAGYKPDIFLYFPMKEDMYRLPRQWIINVAYSLLGDEFRHWVSKRVVERNVHVAKTHNLFINIDPAIAKIFADSTHTSRKYSPDRCLLSAL